ncbi:enoyl-CoA hydratase/isomerase family protein [Falsiroseomonas sp. CW058]|uniref:enoyl-CoA hydratase/isomerase family protein n=1 Tax=Falsiroseomonas sp. CW058 TaxID=3388664 RepID=UPI003D31D478
MPNDAVLSTTPEEGILLLTLFHPGRRNALTEAMRLSLIAALDGAAADPAVRAVVLGGTDEGFCAGQDRAVLRALDAANVEGWVRGLGALYDAIRRFPKPMVAAVGGAAAGAGLQMALCCDLRLASPAARLLQPEIRAGLASVMGPFLIGLHAGEGVVRRMALACEGLDAEAARAAGLVDAVVPAAVLPARAVAAAQAMAAADPDAFRASKDYIRSRSEGGFRDAIEAGVAAQAACVEAGAYRRLLG